MTSSSKRKIFSALVVVVVVVVGIAVAVIGCEADNSRTKQQVDELVEVLASRDASAIYAVCDEETKSTYTEQDIADRLSSFYDTMAAQDASYDNVEKDSKASQKDDLVYTATNTVTLHNGQFSESATFHFTKQGDQLLIHWTPQTVINDLTMDNEVEVEIQKGKRGTIYSRDGSVLAQDDENGSRVYPTGSVTGSLVGYVRAATATEIEEESVDAASIGTEVGRAGLEEAYDDRLRAESGLTIALSDAKEQPLFTSQPEDGEDITTTIDLDLQEAAYNMLSGETFAEVTVEPKTGQVLAATDSSSYNPALWTDEAMDDETYAAHVENGTVPGNGLFADRFTPGSTQKLLTAYCGFKAGTLTQDTTYTINGLDWAPSSGWGSYKVHRVVEVDGSVNLYQALVYSDNIYFARVGLDMGYDAFNNGMKALGFEEEVPTPYEVETAQITAEGAVEEGHETGLADSSYGQYQVQVSPLQQALIYSSLENGGNIMKPCFLMDEEPEIWKQGVVSEENIDFINKTLRAAVTVSHPSADRSFASIAGKTGTAEIGTDGSVNLGWMMGYDLDNPTTMNCIMVNHVEDRGGSDINASYMGKLFDYMYANGAYSPSNSGDETADSSEQSSDTENE